MICAWEKWDKFNEDPFWYYQEPGGFLSKEYPSLGNINSCLALKNQVQRSCVDSKAMISVTLLIYICSLWDYSQTCLNSSKSVTQKNSTMFSGQMIDYLAASCSTCSCRCIRVWPAGHRFRSSRCWKDNFPSEVRKEFPTAWKKFFSELDARHWWKLTNENKKGWFKC